MVASFVDSVRTVRRAMQAHGPRGDTTVPLTGNDDPDDDPQVANLCQRYPDKTADEVRAALRESEGHAGQAARLLRPRKPAPATEAPSTALMVASDDPWDSVAAAADSSRTGSDGLAREEGANEDDDDELDDEEYEDIDLFDMKKPKHVLSGLGTGAKSMLKGAAAGIFGLFAAPIEGALSGGAKGFVKGLGVGIGGAILMPCAGACVAAVQVTRGVIHTPAAVVNSSRGRDWDSENRKWMDHTPFILEEQAQRTLNEDADDAEDADGNAEDGSGGADGEGKKNHKKKCTKQVKETGYYDLLNVITRQQSACIQLEMSFVLGTFSDRSLSLPAPSDTVGGARCHLWRDQEIVL